LVIIGCYMEKGNSILLNLLGVFFVIFGIVAIINSILIGIPDQIFWFCYFGLLLIGVGALIRSSFLIASQINILAIPLVVWIIDFIVVFLTGGSFLGVTDYFFEGGPLLARAITMQHIFTLPLALIMIYWIKLGRKDMWKVSCVQTVVLFGVARMITDPKYNVNCAFESCFRFEFGFFYPLWWIALVFVLVVFTNYLISRMRFLYGENKNLRRRRRIK
jgi:hypothetical protein